MVFKLIITECMSSLAFPGLCTIVLYAVGKNITIINMNITFYHHYSLFVCVPPHLQHLWPRFVTCDAEVLCYLVIHLQDVLPLQACC